MMSEEAQLKPVCSSDACLLFQLYCAASGFTSIQ